MIFLRKSGCVGEIGSTTEKYPGEVDGAGISSQLFVGLPRLVSIARGREIATLWQRGF